MFNLRIRKKMTELANTRQTSTPLQPAGRHVASFIRLLFTVLLCATAVMAPAQESGTLAGTVADPSGAVVSGARVSIQNLDTQTTRVVTSNAGGAYVAPSLAAGNYAITVNAPGFRELKRTGVHVTGATTVTVDLQLVVGEQNEVVSVASTTPLLQTLTAEVSALVDSNQMVALPLATRDFTDLVLLTPGAHVGSASNLAELGSPYAMRGGANYSVNGSIAAGNSYLIDGLFDRNQWLNTLVMVPVVDSILEYRVLTSNYSAEYGEAAGAVTTVETKSGTDSLHGNIWEFFRNDKLNANNYFNKKSGIARPGFHRNEFGGTIGGPIIHHKTFFFADYQGIRASQPVTTTSTIPTAAQALNQRPRKTLGFETPASKLQASVASTG
jgi:Carboxypeptidase regulatory-like domain